MVKLDAENQEKTYHLIYDIVQDLINLAEYETENVCQVCGKRFWSDKEKFVSTGWIGFYCKECIEKKGISVFEKKEDTP